MSEKIKFLHTGDIHLGRPLKCGGEAPEHLAPLFNDASYKALQRIFNEAIERKVDFVLISGDLYDSEARSIKASRQFLEECQCLNDYNIPIYIISGNHDPRGEEKEPFSFPENVFFLDSEDVEMINHMAQEENVLARILGQSYRTKFESRKMYTYYTVPDENCYNLGLLHTQLNPDNNRYVPISRSDLEEKDDIHYWALGHIHEPRVLRSSSPALVYSGTPQGHNISEQGIKGCFIVESSSSKPEEKPLITFVPLSPLIYKKLEIDIGKTDKTLKNLSDLQETLINKTEKLLKQNLKNEINFPGEENDNVLIDEDIDQPVQGIIIRWLITGRGPLHELIDDNKEEAERELKEYLNDRFASPHMEPFVWTHSLQFRTSEEVPAMEELKNNEIYQEVEAVLEEIKTDQEKEKELLNNWGRIWDGDQEQEERDNDKFYPDQETKEEILKAAREKIITHLFGGGEKE